MLKKLYERQIRSLLLYQKKFNCYWEKVSFYQELIQIVGFFQIYLAADGNCSRKIDN